MYLDNEQDRRQHGFVFKGPVAFLCECVPNYVVRGAPEYVVAHASSGKVVFHAYLNCLFLLKSLCNFVEISSVFFSVLVGGLHVLVLWCVGVGCRYVWTEVQVNWVYGCRVVCGGRSVF